MTPPERDGDLEVELLARRDLPYPSQRRADAIDAELRTLAAEDDVCGYERRTWPKRIRVDGCGDDHRDRYLTYAAWADREGVSLQPFFHTRERYCTDAEAYTDCIVVPAMTLAVSVAGELSAVYPYADGDRTATVDDGLAAVRSAGAGSDDETVVPAD